jgi:hypothetical protein
MDTLASEADKTNSRVEKTWEKHWEKSIFSQSSQSLMMRFDQVLLTDQIWLETFIAKMLQI